MISDNGIVVKGEVFTEQQKEAINEVISSVAPNTEIKNQVLVRILNPPEGSEAIT
jgi:hypothetical protein